MERTGNSGHAHQLLLRLEEPAPGIAHLLALPMGGGACAAVRVYLYGDAAAAALAREEPGWRAWLDERFPPPG